MYCDNTLENHRLKIQWWLGKGVSRGFIISLIFALFEHFCMACEQAHHGTHGVFCPQITEWFQRYLECLGGGDTQKLRWLHPL